MRYFSSFFICVFISFFLITSFGFSAQKNSKTDSNIKSEKKEVVQNKSKDKIKDFLNVIEKSQSIEKLATSFKKSNFTSSELKELEKELKKPSYSNKLEQLKSKLERSSKSDLRRSKGTKKSDLKALNANLNKKQQQSIEKLNRDASKFLSQNKQSSMTSLARRPPASRSVQAPETIAFATRSLPESDVDIRDITGDPLIGQSIVFHGSGFGSERGRVSFAIVDSDNRIAFYGNVQSWSNSRIQVTIPLDFESYVDFEDSSRRSMGGEHVYLCVFPEGDDPGTCMDYTIILDPDRFAPTITHLSSTEISPGQRLVITGNNLAPGGVAPEITFFLGRHRIERFDLEEIENTYISLRIPDDIDGMLEIAGRVELRSALGRTAVHPVTFIPAEEMVEIRTDAMTARCEPWHPKVFCWGGEIETFTQHDWVLRNGWTVETSWLDTTTHGPNAGAYYDQQPDPGSTRAESVIKVWADAFSIATCEEVLVLKGPKGCIRQSH